MTNPPQDPRTTVRINEGTLKKNINPPPTSPRPPAPQSQVAPRTPPQSPPTTRRQG